LFDHVASKYDSLNCTCLKYILGGTLFGTIHINKFGTGLSCTNWYISVPILEILLEKLSTDFEMS
ncbi:MAG: hypothetical protein ACTSYA_02885, partial [Candidatus Kariarchaeaceae archaeon]